MYTFFSQQLLRDIKNAKFDVDFKFVERIMQKAVKAKVIEI
jgi:hypothetical protein